MSFMDWVGTVGAIWLAVSILMGICWALVGRRIFRQPPTPTGKPVARGPMASTYADFVRQQEPRRECLQCVRLEEEMRGRK